jgi:hypothetical protein
LARELLDVLGLLMETAEVEVQLEAIKVIQHLLTKLPASWFIEALLGNFLEISLSTVHRHIPNIFPTENGTLPQYCC